MKMKSIALVGVLSLMVGIPTQIHASPLTYTFSGTLTDIRGGGAGIALGTSFLGSYIYDDAPQFGSLIESGRQLYTGGQFGVSAGPSTFLGSIASELQVFDDWTSVIGGYDKDDGYFVSSRIYGTNGADFDLIQFDLWDFTGATLSSLAIPSHSQFKQLATQGRVWVRRFEGGVETGLASGNFDSVAAPIPEPETYAMMLAGLGLLGLTARRRRQQLNA